MYSNLRTSNSCGAREACLEMEVWMLVRTLTSASVVLALVALLPFCVGCESVPDMSAPAAASDVSTERAPDDPTSDDYVIISPSTLVLNSEGWGLTVHVAFPFSQVDASTVNLEGVEPFSMFADDCGDLVCKFERVDIFELVGEVDEPTKMTLTLYGQDIYGNSIEGSDTITVR